MHSSHAALGLAAILSGVFVDWFTVDALVLVLLVVFLAAEVVADD